MTFNSTTFLKLFNWSLYLLFFSIIISCGNYKSHLSDSRTKNQKPNIIFILLDDLGKEWISKYDADDIETPNIDLLAKEGMQFNNAWSMPQCTPSRVTFLTGQYPFRHAWLNHYYVPRWGHGVNFDSNKNPSTPKIMQQAGYKTCAAGKWQINDFRLQPTVMNDHGFDEYAMWTGVEGGNETLSQERYWNPYILSLIHI